MRSNLLVVVVCSGGLGFCGEQCPAAEAPLQATIKAHPKGVWRVAFTPDGKMLASGGRDEVIRLWDVKTGKTTTTLKGHSGTVFALAFSPDGKTLASGSGDGTVRLWDAKTGKNITTRPGFRKIARLI